MVKPALALLELMIKDYPEPTDLAQTYLQKARCHLRLNQVDAAVASYRLAIETEKQYPQFRTEASFQYCWLVVRQQMEAHYSEVLNILEHHVDVLLVPSHEFIYHAVLALINYDKGNNLTAKGSAEKALAAAEKTSSGLRYHKNIGLVGKQDDALMLRLTEIAAVNKGVKTDWR